MKELIDALWNMEAWKAAFIVVVLLSVIFNRSTKA